MKCTLPDYLDGQGLKACFEFELETRRFHSAQQPALAVPQLGQFGRQDIIIPGETRPVGLLVYPGHIHRSFCGD